MKKIILTLVAMVMTCYVALSQTKTPHFTYKVGIATSLPVDVNQNENTINVSSAIVESAFKSSKFSKKLSIVFNSGYLRFKKADGTNYARIPVTVGLKYPINDIFYFGASSGVSYYNKSTFGKNEFLFSPFVGLQVKHISVDARYLNFTNSDNTNKTVGLVFSYIL